MVAPVPTCLITAHLVIIKQMAMDTVRRRRHSGSGAAIAAPRPVVRTAGPTVNSRLAPPRPKSTPAHHRPHQRRRQKGPGDSDDEGAANNADSDGDENMANTNEDLETKEFDRLSQAGSDADSWDDASSSASTTSSLPRKISVVKKDEEIQESPIGGSSQRPTKPLPASKIRNLDSKMPPNVVPPIVHPANPSMLPVQAHVPRNSVVSPQRRLFVILEQACLEAYRVSSAGGKGRYSKGGEEQVKYTLLNCDDHQGILAKTGRDIADARPDITHQVRIKDRSFSSSIGTSPCLRFFPLSMKLEGLPRGHAWGTIHRCSYLADLDSTFLWAAYLRHSLRLTHVHPLLCTYAGVAAAVYPTLQAMSP